MSVYKSRSVGEERTNNHMPDRREYMFQCDSTTANIMTGDPETNAHDRCNQCVWRYTAY
ncbi:MAG: hypothetical protein VXY77_04030 [Pseudomonadota bacterium]|nr:hypothetical protein [Pseudomonadota bacterium]